MKNVDELPLVLGQLTKFKCGGSICLGMNVSYVVVDGQSALHFMAKWARLACGEPLQMAPYFDPDIFRDKYISKILTHNVHKKFNLPLLLIGEENTLKQCE